MPMNRRHILLAAGASAGSPGSVVATLKGSLDLGTAMHLERGSGRAWVGLLSGGVPCYGVYETADGRHMAVGALEEKFWHLLCDALGRADLKPGHLAEGAEGARVRGELAAIFRSRSQRDWVTVFDAVDCCVTPVLRLEESLEDAQLRARGMVVEVGGVRQFGPAVRMTAMPAASMRAAPAVVGADEKENGVRATLNLGHTFGHAIETHMGYGVWLHGEAVAAGTVMALEMSARLGWITEQERDRGIRLFQRAGLPVIPPEEMTEADFLEHMAVDKKVIDGRLRLVLLRRMGEAVVTDDYPKEILQATLGADYRALAQLKG